MNFDDQIRYDRLFQQVIHKGEESAIKYIKIFHNAKALEISVRNSCTEDQLMHTFLDNFIKVGSTLIRKQSNKNNFEEKKIYWSKIIIYIWNTNWLF